MKPHLLLVTAFAVLGILPAFAAPNPPKDLPASDWNSILAAHDAAQRAIVADEDGTHSALTPSQGWQVRFDGRGFTLHPNSGDWECGLSLQSYEFGPDHVVVPKDETTVSSEANCLTSGRGANPTTRRASMATRLITPPTVLNPFHPSSPLPGRRQL